MRLFGGVELPLTTRELANLEPGSRDVAMVDCDAYGDDGKTPLLRAVGRREAGRRRRTGFNRAPLDDHDIDVVRNVDLPRLDFLLRSGVDPDSAILGESRSGWNLLSVALHKRDLRFASMLLQHGADVHRLIDVDGWAMPADTTRMRAHRFEGLDEPISLSDYALQQRESLVSEAVKFDSELRVQADFVALEAASRQGDSYAKWTSC